MQANNLPSDLAAALGGVTGKGNRIDEYTDYGFEIGGPILRDRLWAWGAYGKTDVTLLTLANTPDQTILENVSFKATGQATQNLRGSYTYFRGDKLKYGRNAGRTRPPETTWNQTGPSPVHKVEANVVLGNNLFVTGRWGYVGGGFQLTPQGGFDTQIYRDDGRVYHNSFIHYETVRPQWNSAAEGNYFRGRHEIKFGFGWRRADVDSTTIVPGNGIITYHAGYPGMFAGVTAWDHYASVRGIYTHAYVGDTLTFNRLTLSLGARWDRQSSSVNELTTPGNAVLPDLLPPLTGMAAEDVIVWNSVVPRIGLSYALDESRRTLARASYGVFASQLNATQGSFFSTADARGVYLYGLQDTNGNQIADPEELGSFTRRRHYGFNIDDPGNAGSPIHRIGEYGTPLTHEVQFGMDRELMPNFGLSGTFTYRRFVGFNWRNNGLVGSDYVQTDTVTGSHPALGAYSAPVFTPIPERVPVNTDATIYRDQEGYHQRFWGLELAATKRLSNRWMARFGFSTNDHREYFDGLDAMTDPTRQITTLGVFNNQDGAVVVRSSLGSGKSGIYQVLPRYQFVGTGLYQAPWGVNLAANVVTRQGFGALYFHGEYETSDPVLPNKNVILVSDPEDVRLSAVTSLDARIGKEFVFNRVRFNVDLDVFNLMNSNTVLGRQYDLNATTADQVQEIMNPRILRLGVRFNF
jgi:hypothetical protein